MPVTKSARKRMKTSARKREANRSTRSRIATARALLLSRMEKGNAEEAQNAVRAYFSALDKAVKHGVVKANTANRSKSRATKRLRGMLARNTAS